MTFQVRVKCLICRMLTDPTINSEEEASAEALNLLHNKLCLALKLEFSPEIQDWDFTEEPFPYCESCCQKLQRLGELIDQLKSIEEEISGSLATVSALVITSDKRETNCGDSDLLIKAELGHAKDHFGSRGLQEKHNNFRSLIIQRINPRINVERCDDNYNYQGLSDEDYEYELVPKPTFIKTEPAIEDFPDTTAEETITTETEYKVDTRTLLSEEPMTYLDFVSDASNKSESLIPTLNSANVFVTKPSSQDSVVQIDEASKTGEFKGFKFKELENGCYQCSTCGRIPAKPQGRTKTKNIVRHIWRSHIDTPRTDVVKSKNGSKVCNECSQVFTSPQSLYLHRSKHHRATSFPCPHCGASFPMSSKLKEHVLLTHKAKGEKPFGCDECGHFFSRQFQFEIHSRLHTRRRAIENELENPTTIFSDSNDPSRRTHEISGFKFKKVENGYECCTCGHVAALPKGTQSKETYIKLHIKHVHLGYPRSTSYRNGPRVCEECGEVCTSSQTLSNHRVMAHGSPKFRCGYCGGKFRYKSLLERHLSTHIKKRKKRKPRLVKSVTEGPSHTPGGEHMLNGMEIKVESSSVVTGSEEPETIIGLEEEWTSLSTVVVPQLTSVPKTSNKVKKPTSTFPPTAVKLSRQKVCKECGTCFESSQALYAHRLSNHRSRNFQCDQCGAKFLLKCQLSSHLKVHSEERPYACVECEQSFNLKRHLEVHSRMHTRKRALEDNVEGPTATATISSANDRGV